MKDYINFSVSDFLDEILKNRLTKVEIRVYVFGIIRLLKNNDFLNDYLEVISREIDTILHFTIPDDVNNEKVQRFKEALLNNCNSEDIWHRNKKGEYLKYAPKLFSINDITNESFKSKLIETFDLRQKIDIICNEFGDVTFIDEYHRDEGYCRRMIDFADVLKEEYKNKVDEDYLNNHLNSNLQIKNNDQRPMLDDLMKQWILSDNIDKFINIEDELLARGYIDDLHKWGKTKIELAEFACVLIHYKIFKPLVNRKKIQDFHKRQFISERYGFSKTGLTDTWKKSKPTIGQSLITYFWIESLINSTN